MTAGGSSPWSRLHLLVDGIEILGDTSYRIGGARFELPEEGATAEEAEPPIVSHLRTRLYEHAFCRRYPEEFNTASRPSSPEKIAGEFIEQIAAANSGRSGFENGWTVVRALPNGAIYAEKNGVVRQCAAGEYIAAEAVPVRPSSNVWIHRRVESRHLQPGFFWITGEASLGQGGEWPLVRLYWNVRAEGCARLVELVTGRLNAFKIPFSFKCLCDPLTYDRADAALLYVGRRYYTVAASVLQEAHDTVAGHLEPWTPLWTKTLAPGLGVAEDPGDGQSFGMHRCGVLAGALWAAHQNGCSPDERPERVVRAFQERGLDPDRPYLNCGSADIYEFS